MPLLPPARCCLLRDDDITLIRAIDTLPYAFHYGGRRRQDARYSSDMIYYMRDMVYAARKRKMRARALLFVV